MVACDVEAGCNFERFRGKQHPIGKSAELVSSLLAQGHLAHYGAHRFETMTLLA